MEKCARIFVFAGHISLYNRGLEVLLAAWNHLDGLQDYIRLITDPGTCISKKCRRGLLCARKIVGSSVKTSLKEKVGRYRWVDLVR